MWPTRDDAVYMYARYWRVKHGTRAVEAAKITAAELSEKGDLDGEKIWSEVAYEIEKIETSKFVFGP